MQSNQVGYPYHHQVQSRSTKINLVKLLQHLTHILPNSLVTPPLVDALGLVK